MKAVTLHEHGDLDKLIYEEIDTPEPGHGEVLVKVRACALNHLDIWLRQGLPALAIPLPHILGCDVAGEVASVGAGVEGVSDGDPVLVAPGMSCGLCDDCRAGHDNLCEKYTILGFKVWGGYAEYVKVPARNLMPISDKLKFEEWAAIPLVFQTSWHMLFQRAELKSGEDVLIHAAGSGIGSAAIQIAKLAGARVFATASTDEKLKKAEALGADFTINYAKKDFAKEVKDLTAGRGVDVVFEHIGPETWQKSMACLAKNGRLTTCGATSGFEVSIDLRFLFMRHHTVVGSYMGWHSELLEVLKHVKRGTLKPVVDSVFALKDAAKAHQKMLDRDIFGKLVLVPE